MKIKKEDEKLSLFIVYAAPWNFAGEWYATQPPRNSQSMGQIPAVSLFTPCVAPLTLGQFTEVTASGSGFN